MTACETHHSQGSKQVTTSSDTQEFDLFVIGGGVNGCGIARDAAGRGLSVGLAEMGDLGAATSSASTKLFHGGLRYLEYLLGHRQSYMMGLAKFHPSFLCNTPLPLRYRI